jgi:hypothetical protein
VQSGIPKRWECNEWDSGGELRDSCIVLYYNTQNQPGNKAKTSAQHNGEHAAPSSPDSKSTKPTSTA